MNMVLFKVVVLLLSCSGLSAQTMNELNVATQNLQFKVSEIGKGARPARGVYDAETRAISKSLEKLREAKVLILVTYEIRIKEHIKNDAVDKIHLFIDFADSLATKYGVYSAREMMGVGNAFMLTQLNPPDLKKINKYKVKCYLSASEHKAFSEKVKQMQDIKKLEKWD